MPNSSARRLTLVSILAAATAGATVLGPASAEAEAPAAPSTLPAAATADPHGVSLRLSRVSSGFDQPVLVTAARDGRPRLYVVERDGRIKIWSTQGGRASGSFLDIHGRVNSSGGEQGLLGLAFSPRYATNHKFWVSYTDSTGALQVSRFIASSGTTAHVRTPEKKVIRIAHPTYTNHNAGMLAFGPDGHLYVSTGDGGGSGDPSANAHDRTSLSGKVLRIDPYHRCDGRPYCVPSTNPYAAPGGARGQIWLSGMRNPWRFSFDRGTGDLWIADVGQSRYEEIDQVPAGVSAWDMGWSCMEANVVYNASRCRSGTTYHGPVTAYGRSGGGAVIGGYVYRGSTYASTLGGLYVFGDFISGRLWVYGQGTRVHVGDVGANRLSAFGEGDTAGLYATTLDGGLYRVDAFAS